MQPEIAAPQGALRNNAKEAFYEQDCGYILVWHGQPVSYTHLDVYKRQVLAVLIYFLVRPNKYNADYKKGSELSAKLSGKVRA